MVAMYFYYNGARTGLQAEPVSSCILQNFYSNLQIISCILQNSVLYCPCQTDNAMEECKMKKIADERITRESNALIATAFWMMLILQAGVLAAKLAMGAAVQVCILDMAVLAVGVIGLIVLRTVKGLWGAKDDALREIEQAGLSKIFGTMLWMMLLGELLLVFLDSANMLWYVPFFIVWGIPALYVTILSIRRGLMLWGSRKAESTGKSRLAKSTAVGALFFGLVMGGPDCFADGAFVPAGLLKVLGMGAMWGILFYLMMLGMIKLGEKKADQAVSTAEEAANEE